MPRLPDLPELDWDQSGAPRARAFDDVYFSSAGGLAEARQVFLAGCGLPEGWAGRTVFAIGELGFGAGLNALATWELWARTRAAGAVLHFVSIEAFLMREDQARRALAPFTALAPFAERLGRVWPVRARGAQRFWFPEDGFALTVICAPANEALGGLAGAFDAWFLDGFSPARNPDLWTPGLMARVAALSAPGARAASYSVAGAVRRALEAAGFACEKHPGFGAKRERLEARLRAGRTDAERGPFSIYPEAPAPARAAAAIIGSGVAGACAARAFARRGLKPVVLEAAPMVASGASGAAAALLMPRLERTDTPLGRLHLAAYLFALKFYEHLGVDAFAPIGVEQRPANAREAASFAAFAADPPLPETLLRAVGASLFHPRAGLVWPRKAIEMLLENADLRLSSPVAALARRNGRWTLLGPRREPLIEADIVVLACGAQLTKFAAAGFLPLRYSRGQIERAALAGIGLAHALAAGAYVAPIAGGIVFGSTFDQVDPDATPAASAASTARNLAALERLAPDLAARVDRATIEGRAGVRVSAPDLAPLAGLAPNAAPWLARYEGLRRGARMDLSSAAPAADGLYILGGLGARGFLLAPLLGEQIVAGALGEPSVLDRGAREAMHPARFLARALKRGLSPEQILQGLE